MAFTGIDLYIPILSILTLRAPPFLFPLGHGAYLSLLPSSYLMRPLAISTTNRPWPMTTTIPTVYPNHNQANH